MRPLVREKRGFLEYGTKVRPKITLVTSLGRGSGVDATAFSRVSRPAGHGPCLLVPAWASWKTGKPSFQTSSELGHLKTALISKKREP